MRSTDGSTSRFGPGEPTERRRYLEMLCRGGYPEIVRLDPLLRDDWYDSYIETVTRRDLFELADIRRKAAFPSLLRWAAAATATEINITTAANDLGIDRSTVVSYLEWLRTVFLIHELPPWSRNFISRAVRRSKLHVTDTGLAANLLGIGADMLAPATAQATSSPTAGHLRHVRWLRDKLDSVAPGTFRAGVLLHTGPQSLAVGDRLHLRPISMLWSTWHAGNQVPS